MTPHLLSFDGEQTKGLIHPKPYHSNSVKLCAKSFNRTPKALRPVLPQASKN